MKIPGDVRRSSIMASSKAVSVWDRAKLTCLVLKTIPVEGDGENDCPFQLKSEREVFHKEEFLFIPMSKES